MYRFYVTILLLVSQCQTVNANLGEKSQMLTATKKTSLSKEDFDKDDADLKAYIEDDQGSKLTPSQRSNLVLFYCVGGLLVLAIVYWTVLHIRKRTSKKLKMGNDFYNEREPLMKSSTSSVGYSVGRNKDVLASSSDKQKHPSGTQNININDDMDSDSAQDIMLAPGALSDSMKQHQEAMKDHEAKLSVHNGSPYLKQHKKDMIAAQEAQERLLAAVDKHKGYSNP